MQWCQLGCFLSLFVLSKTLLEIELCCTNDCEQDEIIDLIRQFQKRMENIEAVQDQIQAEYNQVNVNVGERRQAGSKKL